MLLTTTATRAGTANGLIMGSLDFPRSRGKEGGGGWRKKKKHGKKIVEAKIGPHINLIRREEGARESTECCKVN